MKTPIFNSSVFCAAVLLAAGLNTARAADSADSSTASDQLEEVIVTGIRASIQSATGAKRNSGDIVEVISAEDLGKLPDTSIAESISRLPGLTSQRTDGRASDVSVRGTDPQFATALMNGRQQVSTGDNRNIEFDQYPSELISSVTVYKTPDAALIGQGLSGTIALQTTRPLEYGRRALAVNLRGEKNSDADLGSDSKNNGYRFSVSYIDQYLNNTLGVTLGFARLYSPIVGRELGTYDPWHLNGTEHAGVGADVWVTDGIKSLASSGHNARNGSMGTIEWRPTEAFTATLDGYYTSAEAGNNRRSLEVNLGNYPNTTNYSNLQLGANNTLVGATISNAVPLARNFFYDTRDQIFATGLNTKWAGDAWSLMGDLSLSHASRDEHDYETQAQYLGGVTDTVSYSLPGGGSEQPKFGALNAYTDPALVQVGPTIYGAGYSRFPHVTDELKSVRIEADRKLGGLFSDVLFGVNYDDRDKDKRQPEGSLSTLTNTNGGYWQVASGLLLPPSNLGFSGTPGSLAWDVPAVLAAYFNPIAATTNANYLVSKTWTVTEKVTTLYAKGNLDQELFSAVTLRGNIGVQLVHTNQSSTGALWDDLTNTPHSYTDGVSYNTALPAMNLIFQFPNQQDLRFSVARELARPRMDQMAASNEFSVAAPTTGTTGTPSVNAGDPKLRPWMADALDLSYEKYFDDNKGYVAVAGFYKNLKTYIYQVNISGADLSQYVNSIPAGTYPYPVATTGYFNGPKNNSGGRLEGLEATLSLPGSLLANALDGFGAILSVSETNSSIEVKGTVAQEPSSNIPLPGLSKTVWSATAYYEKSGFSARVASRYRSNYVGEIDDFSGSRALNYVRHEQITDFQLGYEFQGGPSQGLSVLFQVNNLTNAPFIDFSQIQTRVRDYETFGRDFFLGLNYKFQR